MEVRILRYPTDADWSRCHHLATATAGHAKDEVPPVSWRRSILRAGHSPIRSLWWTIEITDVPYWVSVHLVRHKVGVEHYVRSQRNDRQHDYDRNAAPQDAPVTHVIDINAQALMQMMRMRLCRKAATETREVAEDIRDAVLVVSPELDGLLAPTCERYGTCDEMRPCGRLGADPARRERPITDDATHMDAEHDFRR